MVCHLGLMTSSLLLPMVLIFKFPDWQWFMACYKTGGFNLNQCCGVWLPIYGGPGFCSTEGWHGTLLFLPVFRPATHENEDLALAVHVFISISASLQVIVCFGSFWCDTLVFFELIIPPLCVE